jgi:hypothetical protein
MSKAIQIIAVWFTLCSLLTVVAVVAGAVWIVRGW